MTTQQKRSLLGWLATVVLIPLLSWAAIRYDATLVGQAQYQREQAVIAGKLDALAVTVDRVLDVACDGRTPKPRGCR